jgi:hypothetical protein
MSLSGKVMTRVDGLLSRLGSFSDCSSQLGREKEGEDEKETQLAEESVLQTRKGKLIKTYS